MTAHTTTSEQCHGRSSWRPPAATREYFVPNLTELVRNWRESLQQVWVARHVAPPGKATQLRCDAHLRLHVMLEGQFEIAAGFAGRWQRLTLRPGDCWVVPPYAFEQERRVGSFAFAGVVLRPTVVRVLYAQRGPEGRLWGNTPWAYHARPLPPKSRRQVDRFASDLATCDDHATSLRRDVRDLLRMVIKHLRSEQSCNAAISVSYRSWQVAMEYVNRGVGDRLTRTHVADAVGLHPNYLSALCHRFARCTFQQMVEDARMARARRFLRHTAWPVHDIAARCGFTSSGYFIRVFRQTFGQTPRRYRVAPVSSATDAASVPPRG